MSELSVEAHGAAASPCILAGGTVDCCRAELMSALGQKRTKPSPAKIHLCPLLLQ
jgi:hypothetical protein